MVFCNMVLIKTLEKYLNQFNFSKMEGPLSVTLIQRRPAIPITMSLLVQQFAVNFYLRILKTKRNKPIFRNSGTFYMTFTWQSKKHCQYYNGNRYLLMSANNNATIFKHFLYTNERLITSEKRKLLLMTTKLKRNFRRKIHFLAIYYLPVITNIFYSLYLTIIGLCTTFFKIIKTVHIII